MFLLNAIRHRRSHNDNENDGSEDDGGSSNNNNNDRSVHSAQSRGGVGRGLERSRRNYEEPSVQITSLLSAEPQRRRTRSLSVRSVFGNTQTSGRSRRGDVVPNRSTAFVNHDNTGQQLQSRGSFSVRMTASIRRPTVATQPYENSRSLVASHRYVQNMYDYDSTEPDTSPLLPLLYSLARIWAWEAVTFRCQTHPHEAAVEYTNRLGDNVLHWVAFGRPPLAPVRALLQLCPDLAKAPNKNGFLPLHVACSYRVSSDVLRAILDAYPAGAAKSTMTSHASAENMEVLLAMGAEIHPTGSYPLHILCDFGCPVDSIRAILETAAGASTVHLTDYTYQRKPLSILYSRNSLTHCHRSLETVRRARHRIQELRKLQKEKKRQQEQESSSIAVNNEIATRGLDYLQEIVWAGLAEATASEDEIEAEIRGLVAEMTTFEESDFWQKAILLMVVEYEKQPLPPLQPSLRELQPWNFSDAVNDDDDANRNGGLSNVRILRASLGNPFCHSCLQEFALLLYHDELLTPDDKGRLPLHLAAMAAASVGTTCDNPLFFSAVVKAEPTAAYARDKDGLVPLALALRQQQKQQYEKDDDKTDKASQHTQQQLQADRVNVQQQGVEIPTPIPRFWSSGLGSLLEANLSVLEELRLDDRLYPYIWSRLSSHDSVFRALQAHPGIIAFASSTTSGERKAHPVPQVESCTESPSTKKLFRWHKASLQKRTTASNGYR